MKDARQQLEQLTARADVMLNGDRPWDIRVHDDRFFARVLRDGSLGLGESYMDAWWDCDQLDELIARILRAQLNKRRDWKIVLDILLWKLFNPQRVSHAFEIGERHYDTGNDLFEKMLDRRMTYTCGYWSGTPADKTLDLDEAQDAKLDLVCRKIGLKKGDHVLDIGCGWGSFMIFAAEKYGAQVTGVTVSQEQVALGRIRAGNLPVEFLLKDYRDIEGTFDHVVSLGMFEHVGEKNYRTFMKTVRRVLKPSGLFLLHTIGKNVASRAPDPWFEKYIFPNSITPSPSQIATAIEKIFVLEDWHNISADYECTLHAWYQNFSTAWPELQQNYSERFRRMWTYYLLAAAGTFRSRFSQLWQIVLSPHGVAGGYRCVR